MATENFGTCVLLINKEGSVLLGQRLSGYQSGTYGLPGGRVEMTELLEDAAKREMKEETGIEVHKLEYVGVIRALQTGYSFIHFVYKSDNFSGEPQVMEPDKCAGWQWYGLDELPDNVMPDHRWAIEMLREGSSQLKDVA